MIPTFETSTARPLDAPVTGSAGSFSQRPLIATSVAPRNLARQAVAIASWIAQGFDVVSVNCAEEIAELTPQFPDVTFRVSTTDARALAGKPLVPLNDLLAALRAENRAVSGIVNSDIVLKPLRATLLSSWLKQTVGDGVAFAKRLDQETEFSPGIRYDGGIDAFFFGRKALFAFPSTAFFVGLPWWDYFFAAYPVLAKIPTVEISEPVAFHLSHPSFYDVQKHWIPMGIDTLRLLSPLLDDNAALVSASGMDSALRRFQGLTTATVDGDREKAVLHAFLQFANAMVQLIELGARPDRVAPPVLPRGRLRLGIPIIADAGWSGGVQLIVDLVNALARLPPDEKPELALVIPASQSHAVAEHTQLFGLVDQIIEVGFNDVGRRHGRLLVVRDFDELFEHIDFLYPAHMMALPGKPAATWIPDFQHQWLPKTFPDDERARCEQRYRALADRADLVVLNSQTARRDWRQFYPNARGVVRIVPSHTFLEPAALALDPASVAAKHGIAEPFLLCANPFWVHKGYHALIEAMAQLARGGRAPLVVCTGSTEDRRVPGFLQMIRARMEKAGVSSRFRILGVVSRDERIALMRRSLAIVQPSLLEGWSTVAEEARALGKTIILSDIQTHREQTSPQAHFYRPDEPAHLASVLAELLPTLSLGPALEEERQAGIDCEALMLRYARAVCALAGEAASICAAVKPAPAISLAASP